MLKSWELENFKSVNNRISLELAPLTVFAGANSSGKSTIIQSILLTTQTIQSQVRSRPVVLNGHIVRLGAFNDIISNLAKSQTISIGFELQIAIKQDLTSSFQRRYLGRYISRDILESFKSIKCDFCFSASGKEIEKDILQLQPRLESCTIIAQGSSEKKSFDKKIEIKKSKIDIAERVKQLKLQASNISNIELSGLEYEVITKPTTTHRLRHYIGVPITGEVVGSSLQHFLPSRFVVVFDSVEEQSRRIIDIFLNPDQPFYYELPSNDMQILGGDFADVIIDLYEDSIKAIPLSDIPTRRLEKVRSAVSSLKDEFSLNNIIKTIRLLPPPIRRDFFHKIDEKKSELRKILKAGKQPEYNLAYIPLPDISDSAADLVQAFFANQVKYLGPLRDEPKPVYPLAGSVDPKDIGFKGENTAAVLEVHRNIRISYIPCNAFTNLTGRFKPKESSLLEAVSDWLEYLGVAHNILTVDKGKLGHELKVSTLGSESLHDLTHVGVGVSQVLPILVQSLLSERGSTLIFEQPELHLHPRVQTRLADFFVSMTMLDKQCIIETHSEYLINRLRYMSAITEEDNISEGVILYFVEKEKGCSEYRPIRINKYGVIEDWPCGFFDENEDNAAKILRASMMKKHKEKSTRKSQ